MNTSFRTMVAGAEFQGAGLAVDAGDSRITRAGAFLRRTSIDELPNLVNVLRGEMAIIGPRPTVPSQVAAYTERQRGRLAVKPGITGWAQVNGRASLPWDERIEMDLWWIEHRSLRLDLEVLRRTAATVLQIPNRDRKDVQINNRAVPILNAEAVQAQSADIDMVSGATVTSVAYIQSLQSAIDKAHL